ncbi:MAG: hypothetical protein KDB26_15900 [Microthrixaceae bacterium]|nr:hypothetical protein [Microthrixaceae bacterium]
MTEYVTYAEMEFRKISRDYFGIEADPYSDEFEQIGEWHRELFLADVPDALNENYVSRATQLGLRLKEHFAKGGVPPKAAPEPKVIDTDFEDDDEI